MSFAHLTLATPDVDGLAAFLEDTLGYRRVPPPANSPVDAMWLDVGRGQQFHLVRVDGFDVSALEGEFARHIAVFQPRDAFDRIKARLCARGAEVFPPLRATGFERFFFREPIAGYVFEVIDRDRSPDPALA
jgi:catechol 2,3-dioxygenase-like lactoylglutathione lyase family enzyme